MDSSSCIEQKGVIERIDNGRASVKIDSFSACAGCHSKAACGVSENSTKNIDVAISDNSFSIGEEVQILMKRNLGMRATFLAYILPFLLVLFFLILFNALHVGELISGIISLLLLIPYYGCLFLFRNRLDKTFTFTLRKVV